MKEEDPFGSILELCQESSPQKSRLNRSRFYEHSPFPASGDEDENCHSPATIPVDSTPIILVSAEESPDDGNTYVEDLYHTALEDSPSANLREDYRIVEVSCNRVEDNVPVDSDGRDSLTAVDLGGDTDLRFSLGEVELTERAEFHLDENDAFRRGLVEPRVSNSGSSLPVERSLEESSSKSWKISGCESANERLGTENKYSREEFLRFCRELKSRILSPSPTDVPVKEKGRDFLRNPRSGGEIRQDYHPSSVTLMNSPNILKRKRNIEMLDSVEHAEDEVRDSEENVEDEMRDTLENVEDEMRLSLEKLEPKNQQKGHSRNEVGEDHCAKIPLHCSTDVIDSDAEKREKEIHFEENYVAEGKRLLPQSNSTVGAAASTMNLTKEAVPPTSSNATQRTAAVAATSSVNVAQPQGTARNASGSNGLNGKKSKLQAVGDVLKAMSEDNLSDENLKSLSLIDIARRRGLVITPSWWPPGGCK